MGVRAAGASDGIGDHSSEHCSGRRNAQVITALVAVAATAWAATGLLSEHAPFAASSATAAHEVEAASALARVFGALVLFLFLAKEHGGRLLWVAMALLVMGLGGLFFGYGMSVVVVGDLLGPVLPEVASLFTRTLAAALLAVGLVPGSPPRCSRRAAVAVLSLFGAGVLALVSLSGHGGSATILWRFLESDMSWSVPDAGRTLFLLSLVPLVLSSAAALGRHVYARGAICPSG